MMAFPKVRSIVAIAAVLVQLLDQTAKVGACSCVSQERDLCDYIDTADVVLRAKALSRSEQNDINDPITYTVLTTTLYKAEPNVRYAQEISFVTGGNSALCGVFLNIDEEYLIGLYWSESGLGTDQGPQLSVGSCDLVRVWSDVTTEDMDTLDAGCGNVDPCGGCGDSQECTLYPPTGEYYCSGVCTPSSCGDEETCSLEDLVCVRAPCPRMVTCTDPCGGCTESQECLMYQRNSKFYCSDNCANSPCADYETCTTKPRKWCRHSGFDGCPSRRRCKANY